MARLNKNVLKALVISSYRLSTGPERIDEDAMIIAQRGTKRFRVETAHGTEVLKLVGKHEGALEPKEFRIQVGDINIPKLTNPILKAIT
jgi:hypothetical protein|tara:strand:- start:173 stop:439 length:267 start_codon:yes stop_codon:yes gene_type:complete